MENNDSITLNYEILIKFFEEEIKLNRDKFDFDYPAELTERTLRKNCRNIRSNIVYDHLRVKFDIHIDKLSTSQVNNINTKIAQLSKASYYRTLSSEEVEHVAPTPRKRRSIVQDKDYDFPSDCSDDDENCPFSKCLKQKNAYLKEIEELKTKIRDQAAEIEQLRSEKNAKELKSYNELYPKLCLYTQKLGFSVRMTNKIMGFLKNNVKALEEIVVPSHTFIHQQRYLIDTISSKRKQRFIESAEYLTMAVDGTPFRNGHFFAVVLFNQDHDKILFGMHYYIRGDSNSLTEVTEKILGESKNLIYSKIKYLISDTDAAQKKSLSNIINHIMQARVVK